MFNIGPTELILILVVALIVFGPKKLPEIGRTIGAAVREFRKASQDLKNSIDLGLDNPQAPGAGQSQGQSGGYSAAGAVVSTSPVSHGPSGSASREMTLTAGQEAAQPGKQG